MTLVEVYLGSKELKKAILDLSFKYEIPLKYICKEAGVNYRTFLEGYINSNNPSIEITEKQFEKILDLLGIERRIQFIVKTNFDAKETQQFLDNKHGREKKGTDTTYKFGDTAFD